MKKRLFLILILTAGGFNTPGAFLQLDNFNGLTNGPLAGRNGWVTTQAAFVVAEDPAGPPNKVLSAPAMAESPVYKALGTLTLSNNTTGTIFLRLRRANAALNISAGASDVAAPTASFGDFEAQLNCNTTTAGNFKVRDAGTADAVDDFVSDTWYKVWMVVDNTRDLVTVYMQGGALTSQTLLTGNTDGETAFTFRNTTGDGLNTNTAPVANHLSTFLIRIGGSHTGPLYVDDIYVDTAGVNLADPTVDTTPPTVSQMQPVPDTTVYALESLTVKFSEPVANVTAADLIVNGQPAASVSGYGDSWVFSFPSPMPGLTQMRWNSSQAIRDFAGNAFAGGDIGSFNYVVDVTPPVVSAVAPVAGSTIHDWPQTQIAVTFSEEVRGVDAADLWVNGSPALTVSGAGSNYTFTAAQPAPGSVALGFAPGHGITDVFNNPLDESLAANTWTYTFADTMPPVVQGLTPKPGTLAVRLETLEVVFNEAVTGLEAGDLLVNGVAAATVTGTGAGPYRFGFAPPPAGPVQFGWAEGHGIADVSGNPFAGGGWNNVQAALRPSGFVLLEDFAGLTNGPLQGQNGWTASNSVQVTADPTQPRNQVLSLANDLAADAWKALDALTLTNQAAGTVFWRFRRADTQINMSHGLTDAAPPAARNFNDFEIQLQSNGTNPPALNTRDAGAFKPVANFTPDAWLSVWVVVDNAADLYSVYLQGGEFPNQTLLTTQTNASEFAYTFRNTAGDGLNGNTGPVASNLTYFLLRSSGASNHVGPFLLDDIYVDGTGTNLSNPLPPPAPSGLSMALVGTEAHLTWEAVASATNYLVERSEVAGGPYSLLSAATTPAWTDGTVVPGATYYYVVVAEGTNGRSFLSTEVSLVLNRAPVAGDLVARTTVNQAVSLTTAQLLAGCTDLDLDPLTVAGTGPSTNGGTVVFNGSEVQYSPVAGFVGLDRFPFTISDGRGGTAEGQALVEVYPGPVAGQNIVAVERLGSAVTFTFAGLPGRQYSIWRALSVLGPWTNLVNVAASPTGLTQFADPNPPAGQAFYRTARPAP